MLYEPVLVVHVAAAALLIGGGILLAAAGFGLTSLERGRELVPWAGVALASAPLTIGSGLALFASGGHLAGTAWTFAEGWITVSAIWLAVLGVATLVLYRRLWRLAEDVRALGEEPAPAPLRARLRSPVTWGVAHALVFGGVAFIPVMVLKTGFLESALWLGLGSLVGVGSGVVVTRRAERIDLAAMASDR